MALLSHTSIPMPSPETSDSFNRDLTKSNSDGSALLTSGPTLERRLPSHSDFAGRLPPHGLFTQDVKCIHQDIDPNLQHGVISTSSSNLAHSLDAQDFPQPTQLSGHSSLDPVPSNAEYTLSMSWGSLESNIPYIQCEAQSPLVPFVPELPTLSEDQDSPVTQSLFSSNFTTPVLEMPLEISTQERNKAISAIDNNFQYNFECFPEFSLDHYYLHDYSSPPGSFTLAPPLQDFPARFPWVDIPDASQGDCHLRASPSLVLP